jgi:DNA-binding NtrC family response regulator
MSALNSVQASYLAIPLWPEIAVLSMNADLDRLVHRMVEGHILYSEAVREFKRAFIETALRDNLDNKNRTARVLRMHRNTLSRNLAELWIKVERRPPQKVGGGKLTRRIG